MKTLFLVLAVLLVAYSSFGQITGKVADREKEPVLFANVVLYHSPDSSIVAGTFTDEKGMFSIKGVSTGTFYLKISSIGYTSLQSKPFEITALNGYLEIYGLLLS